MQGNLTWNLLDHWNFFHLKQFYVVQPSQSPASSMGCKMGSGRTPHYLNSSCHGNLSQCRELNMSCRQKNHCVLTELGQIDMDQTPGYIIHSRSKILKAEKNVTRHMG